MGNPHYHWLFSYTALLLGLWSGLPSRALAQPTSPTPTPTPTTTPPASTTPATAPPTPDTPAAETPTVTPGSIVEAKAEQPACPTFQVTSTTISPIDLTLPSLWWARNIFVAAQEASFSKLIETWEACQRAPQYRGRVDFIVNRQLWSLMTYLERYEFLHRFGITTSGFGYNLRVVDNRGSTVGGYACNFQNLRSPVVVEDALTPAAPPPTRALALDPAPPNAPQPYNCEITLPRGSPLGIKTTSPNPFGS